MSTPPRGAGQKDKLVSVLELVPVEGNGRFPTAEETSPELFQEWMHRFDVPGGENFTAGQVGARFDTVWTMNYRPEMDPDEVDVPKLRRLMFGRRYYDVVGAVLSENRAEIEIRTIASSRVES